MRPIRLGPVALVTSLLAGMTPQAALAGDSQLWVGGSATVKLPAKWNISQDLTARFSDQRGGLYELEANTLLGYQLTKVVSLWAGYDHDPQYSNGHFTVMEHRFVQHLVLTNFAKMGGGQMNARIRLEQRWREGLTGTGWRFRPYVRYSHPLGSGTKLALAISEEPFFDLNKTGFQKVGGLERLRSFIGISAPVSRKFSADLGYMNQHGFVPNGKDTSDNIAFVSLGLKL